MFTLNEVKLIGYVGKNPASSAENKRPFAAFDLATTKRYLPKGENAQVAVETHWHNIVCYEKLAEQAIKLVSKGSQLLICGSLETTEWTDKEGRVHKGSRILASKIVPLDRNNSDK